MRRAEGEFMKLDDQGIPHPIMKEALEEEIENFWRLREKWLYGVITICGVYFLLVLM